VTLAMGPTDDNDTVSTQQHQYSDIMYAKGYTVATCFNCKRSSSGQ